MKTEKSGVHQPTKDLPYLFTYPTSAECRLIASGKKTNEKGCPLHPGCSCSHGLDSYVCKYYGVPL